MSWAHFLRNFNGSASCRRPHGGRFVGALVRWFGPVHSGSILVRLVRSGTVLVRPKSSLVRFESVLVRSRSVLVRSGSVLVRSGSVLVRSGSILVRFGSILVLSRSIQSVRGAFWTEFRRAKTRMFVRTFVPTFVRTSTNVWGPPLFPLRLPLTIAPSELLLL